MLKIRNLEINRGGRQLFKNFNLDLNKGYVIQIVGKNGSGKSTLASAIAGDFKIANGAIVIEGQLCILLQNLEIDFPITTEEFLLLARNRAELQNLALRLNISDLLTKKITQLSKGQLQRVELAQVLLQNPDILILDEPFAAQDQENLANIIKILGQLKSDGKAILLINHIDLELGDLVDQILNLN